MSYLSISFRYTFLSSLSCSNGLVRFGRSLARSKLGQSAWHIVVRIISINWLTFMSSKLVRLSATIATTNIMLSYTFWRCVDGIWFGRAFCPSPPLLTQRKHAKDTQMNTIRPKGNTLFDWIRCACLRCVFIVCVLGLFSKCEKITRNKQQSTSTERA